MVSTWRPVLVPALRRRQVKVSQRERATLSASAGHLASWQSLARQPRERFHKITVTRAFRHSGGHAGPFGRVTSYVGCLVTQLTPEW